MLGRTYRLRITSVLGHIMGVDFPEATKNWYETEMESLFHIPLVKQPLETSAQIVQNIK
jgi:DNA topoisomerase IA